MPDRVAEHCRLFNEAVRAGEWNAYMETFAPDAVMRFTGVPAGPFTGRDAIEAAYAERPPTDTLTVESTTRRGDVDLVRFRWDAGGSGTLRVRWQDDLIADLTIAFDE